MNISGTQVVRHCYGNCNNAMLKSNLCRKKKISLGNIFIVWLVTVKNVSENLKKTESLPALRSAFQLSSLLLKLQIQ